MVFKLQYIGRVSAILCLMYCGQSLFLGPALLIAQIQNPDISYIQAGWQQQQFKGLTQYMQFHNTTATNLPYHQHYVYDPFGSSAETFSTTHIEARYYINRRSFLMVNLPFAFNERITSDTLNMNEIGLGDLILSGGYQLYNSKLFKPDAKLKHIVILQGGVRVPTGVSDRFNEINEAEPHSLPGYGSIGFLFSGLYWLEVEGFQLGLSGYYTLNRENKYTYRFGNLIQSNLQVRYHLPFVSVFDAIPQTGLIWLSQNQDYMNDRPSPEYNEVSRTIFYVGATVQKGKLQAEFNYQLPLSAKVEGPQIDFKSQWQLRFQYNIPQREAKKILPNRSGL